MTAYPWGTDETPAARIERALLLSWPVTFEEAQQLVVLHREQVLREAAEQQRACGNEIADAPPDPHLDPRAGVSFLVAEGWYQAADMIRPKEQS